MQAPSVTALNRNKIGTLFVFVCQVMATAALFCPAILFAATILLCPTLLGRASAQEADTTNSVGDEADERMGFLVNVELPLVGDRDQAVRSQILQIAESAAGAQQRPIVVLQFQSTQLSSEGDAQNGGMGSRGSQFERGLALARFLTSAEASRVRLVAYLPESVEGHAVLPVLACEEVIIAADAELGRAAIDEAVDPSILAAYQDVVSRRATLPEAVVLAMLDASREVHELQLSDGTRLVSGREQADERREKGEVISDDVVWPGGGLAVFTGQQLRSRRWVARTMDDVTLLPRALGLSNALRTVSQLPREWQAASVNISGTAHRSRVNQWIRAIDAAIENREINLLVLSVEPTNIDFQQAARFSTYLADLDIHTLAIILEPIDGNTALVAVACNEASLLSGASISPPAMGTQEEGSRTIGDRSQFLVLDELAAKTGRPLPLLTALADTEIEVKEFIHQTTGKKSIFTERQLANRADANQWLAKTTVASGGEISSEVALRYRLVDSIDDSASTAMSRLGVTSTPEPITTPWLDASIQMLLSQPWISRLLLTIGFFALMVELGNPGISAGGFLAAVCFTGFFWIEGLNGNVEWLEILLFVGGLVAVCIELFVLPGFGLFGIGGLLMLFVSVVLASQTFIWPTTSAELREVALNLFWVACMALGGMIGLLTMHKQIERLPLFRWVALQPGGTDDLDEVDERESLVHHEHLVGQEGLTKTRLNPSGKAQFGRDIVAVVGTGGLIDEGTPVRVVEVMGNLVLVEEITA